MAKLGRPLPDREQRIKNAVFNALSNENRTLDEMAADVKLTTGADRTTVWRHLKRFKKLGIVIHEGQFYRRNPLNESQIHLESLFSVEREKNRAILVRERIAKLPFPRELLTITSPSSVDLQTKIKNIDWWSPKEATPPGLIQRGHLAETFEFMLEYATTGYLNLLEAIANAPSLAAAGEIARILSSTYVSGPLMFLARAVWDERKETSLQELDGKLIRFRVIREKANTDDKKESAKAKKV
jgi:biotin operon repressor